MKCINPISGNNAQWISVFLALLFAMLSGALVPMSSSLVIAGTGALSGLLAVTVLGRRAESLFLAALAVLLLGYATQGRGFSYFGIRPIYVGEMVLALGLAALPFAHLRWKMSSLQLITLAFMGLGFLHTAPYVSEFGLNAFRDAAVWYYALFALIVSLMLNEQRILSAGRWIANLLPILLVWSLCMPTLIALMQHRLPHFPGSPLPIVSVMRPGDQAVVLIGLAAFVSTGLYRKLVTVRRVPAFAIWTIWIACAGLVTIQSRGAFLAIVVAFAFLILGSPSVEWLKGAFVGVIAITLFILINPTLEVGGYRVITVDQLTTNVMSIFSDSTTNQGGVQANKDWRLDWWAEIWNRTFLGSHFWTGQGFGLNLATAYGFETDDSASLRSPHNIHMTILARMGIPGLLVWFALQSVFALKMLGALRQARRLHQDLWSGLIVCLLTIWIAALVNGTFDVYLESPYGAIPFWCVFGVGIAVIRMYSLGSKKRPGRAASAEELSNHAFNY